MSRPAQSRGTVSLVALCFVAVLGISLASYLTICTRAMQLSNRSYQSGLGQQLAELGLEEGLRAFNKGDWGGWSANPTGITGATTAWTLDTTNKRASRTLTFDSTRLGQNVTATVKIRVDNYDANVLGSPYNSAATYRVGDLVYYSGASVVAGNWYRCLVNGVNGSSLAPGTSLGYPYLSYWAPLPIPWMWNSSGSYDLYDVVCYGGVWYYSNTSSNTSNPTVANWTALPAAPSLAITTFTSYTAGMFAFRVGDATWYRCTTSYVSGSTFDPTKWTTSGAIPSWSYSSSKTYSYNDVVFYSSTAGVAGTWYRCIAASSTGNAPTNTSYWENALTGINTTTLPGAHGWSSNSLNYNIGDVVCYVSGGYYNMYRCIRAHTSSTSILPTNTTYWSNSPLMPQDWQPNHQYGQYDTVRYKGVWYLALFSNTGSMPNNAGSGNWAAAPASISRWDSTTYYDLDDLVSNSGTWYRCISPHKNQAPPNSTYWTVLTGSGSSYVWDAGTAYSVGSYRSYGGVWYKCITATAANDGHTPNDSAYWTPTWAQASNSSIVTGASVVYAESTITIAGSPPIKTQIRAPIAPAPLFPNAAGATGSVTASSGGTIDSYDGSARSMATAGTLNYYPWDEYIISPFTSSSHNVGYSATVAGAGTTSPAVTITSATVKGFVAATSASSTPFAPMASFGTSASLLNPDGTTTSPDLTASNVDLTRISRGAFVPQYDTFPSGGLATNWSSVPKGSLLPTATTVTLGIPGATSPARYYYSGNLVMGGTSSVIATLNIVGPVILQVSGDLTMAGSPNGIINIHKTGSLELHVGGSLAVNSGSDGVRSYTADPKSFILICDTTSSATQYYNEGANPLYAVIYLPKLTSSGSIYFNYTDSNSTTLYGAVSATNINYQNNANIHYDTSLRYATFGGIDQPYTVTQWRELSQAEQATMP